MALTESKWAWATAGGKQSQGTQRKSAESSGMIGSLGIGHLRKPEASREPWCANASFKREQTVDRHALGWNDLVLNRSQTSVRSAQEQILIRSFKEGPRSRPSDSPAASDSSSSVGSGFGSRLGRSSSEPSVGGAAQAFPTTSNARYGWHKPQMATLDNYFPKSTSAMSEHTHELVKSKVPYSPNVRFYTFNSMGYDNKPRGGRTM